MIGPNEIYNLDRDIQGFLTSACPYYFVYICQVYLTLVTMMRQVCLGVMAYLIVINS